MHLRAGVERLNLFAIALFQVAAAQLHAGGECSVGNAELSMNHQHPFQLLVLRQVAIHFLNDALLQRLHVERFHQLFVGGEFHVMVLRPLFQLRKIGHDEHGGELALVAQQSCFADQHVGLQRILDGLRGDELSARGLDEVLLAVGDGEESVLIDGANVARLEPAVFKGAGSFFRHIPVAGENGRAPHQNFTIGGDFDFNIGQRPADRSQAVIDGIVQGDHGRGFREAIAFVDANADVGVPGGNLTAQRRASGDEQACAAAECFTDFGKHQGVGQPPRERSWRLSTQNRFAVGSSDGERPFEERTLYSVHLVLHLVVNLLVHAGHGHDDRRLHLAHGSRQVVDAGTVGDGDIVVLQRVIQVPRGDVRKRQIRDAEVVLAYVEHIERNADIGGDVAMREHDALGCAGGAGGVDESREIVRLDGSREGVKFRVGALPRVAQERLHVDRVAQLGSVVHNDDVLKAGLLANGSQLLVLLAGGNEGNTRLGILQHVQDLLGGLRGVDGHDHSAQQQGCVVGDGPLPAVLAQDDYAVALANVPGLQLTSGGVNPAPQLGGGDRLPRFAFAGEHDAVVVAVHDREENFVEGPNAHFECFYGTSLLVGGALRSTRKAVPLAGRQILAQRFSAG